MVEIGNWIIFYFNGEICFDKLFLIYWFMVFVYYFFGINEWFVCFFLVIFGIVLICFGFYILYRYGFYYLNFDIYIFINKFLIVRLLILWISVVMICLNLEIIVWGCIGVFDMLLIGCMCFVLLVFFMGYVL